MSQPKFKKDYTYERVLGEGGFGKVFLCKKNDTLVAVKAIILDGEIDVKYAKREFDMAKLIHPNIVRLNEGWNEGPNDGCPAGITLEKKHKFFIEMEYCNGNSLRGALPTYQGKMSEIVQILRDVTKGLIFIHENRIMHRDLKPENVLLVVDEGWFWNSLKCAKIGDLGLARNLQASVSATGTYSKAMTNLGTPCYWSPEQATERRYDSKTDIYPMGIMFLELLTSDAWSKYLHWDTSKGYVELTLNTTSALGKQYPKEVGMIRQMLSHNPDGRPSAKQVLTWFTAQYP